MVNKLLETLRSLRLENGLYLASTGQHYRKIWIRDCFYEALPELECNPEYYKQTYQTLLDLYIYHEIKHNKLKSLIASPTKYGYEFNHPRCDENLDEIDEPWGFVQLDNYGEFLYGIWLGENQGIKIIRGQQDRAIISLIIKALESVEYWNRADNGIWEENEEIRSSSIGAVVAGLTAIRLLDFYVPQWLIDRGHETLNRLHTRETETRPADLALLTLIYPFNIIDTDRARKDIANIENELLRPMGVIRYKGDKYYNNGKEAEWTFGFSFLALAHKTLGNWEQAEKYKRLVEETILEGNKIPELFYGGTKETNDNNPLGWSVAMGILALKE